MAQSELGCISGVGVERRTLGIPFSVKSTLHVKFSRASLSEYCHAVRRRCPSSAFKSDIDLPMHPALRFLTF